MSTTDYDKNIRQAQAKLAAAKAAKAKHEARIYVPIGKTAVAAFGDRLLHASTQEREDFFKTLVHLWAQHTGQQDPNNPDNQPQN